MTGTSIQSVALVGGCGGFGRAFASLFQASGIAVTIIDQYADADVVLDLTDADAALATHVAGHDLVLLCLAEDMAALALALLSAQDVPGVGLICDICSVKTNICQLAVQTPEAVAYVSIHPMFGPDRGFEDQNLVFIEVRDGPLVAHWRALLESWGVRVLDADADTHDRVTSMVQVLTHATLISFAQAQNQLQVPDDLFQAMTTPIFRSLDDTAQGLLAENPHLYHNIQTANPHGEQVRQMLAKAVQQVVNELGDADPERTAALFRQLLR